MKRRHFNSLAAGAAIGGFARNRSAADRIVVAGGGIIGASIAYHLAKRGAAVTLVEKLRPAGGTTANSFAWINSTFSKQPHEYYNLNLLGIAGWRRLDLATNGELRIQWGGSVEWYPAGESAAALRHDVKRHQSWGYATRLIDEAELRRLLPTVSPGPVSVASFSEQEGAVDPVHAVNVMLQYARQAGAKIEFPSEITGLDLANGRVRTVKTTSGPLAADAVVLACGNDTPRIARMADIAVPLKDSPGVLAHTAPQKPLLDRIALAPGGHIKQKADGRIVTGSDFGGTPITEASRETGQHLLDQAARFLPQLKDAQLQNVTLGWRVMPKDEFPIIGFAGRCPNLYLAAMHSGVTLAPLVGQLAATEILDGVPVDLLQPYRLARFG
jgi:glycine/D-amino acid oxidase-like deaminating enzyme